MSFQEFLYAVGMFPTNMRFSSISSLDFENAKQRYIEAISIGIKGTGALIMKRKTSDIFTNGFNKQIFQIHQANMDIQLVTDHFACASYVCGYLTKNESGLSKLLKQVDDEFGNEMSKYEKLNIISSVIDKNREVSIQEAIYRLLSLEMTKSSVVVKFISTNHPDFRLGLLKANLEELPQSLLYLLH